MNHQDGRKDPNNPTLLDTRQVEYLSLVTAINAYISGSLPGDQVRALHVEWSMNEHEQEIFGSHPLFDLINSFEAAWAGWTEFGDEVQLKKELSALTGYGASTGTNSQPIPSLTMNVGR
jgi:hypothetical protein